MPPENKFFPIHFVPVDEQVLLNHCKSLFFRILNLDEITNENLKPIDYAKYRYLPFEPSIYVRHTSDSPEVYDIIKSEYTMIYDCCDILVVQPMKAVKD